MTTTTTGRPDPRLLVPAACLPFVPQGAPMTFTERWEDGGGWTMEAGTRAWFLRTLGEDFLVAVSFSAPDLEGVHVFAVDPSALALDLSAPALRDGLPERLDVLPWALRVLHPEAVACEANWMPLNAKWGLRMYMGVGEGSVVRPVRLPEEACAGLSPADASRAVLAAALGVRS